MRRVPAAGDGRAPPPSAWRDLPRRGIQQAATRTPVFAGAFGRLNAGADFSSASSDFKLLGAFFCNFATLSFLRLVSRSRARSAARPCTTSCGFEASEPIPFPGPDSIFSSRCGAISRRLHILPSASRAAIPATETPRFKRLTIGSAISAGMRLESYPKRSVSKFFHCIRLLSATFTTLSRPLPAVARRIASRALGRRRAAFAMHEMGAFMAAG